MIDCTGCGKKLFSMSDVENVKMVGFAMFASCKKCGEHQSVSGLWRRTRIEKWVELPKEMKKRNVKK